MATVKTSVVTGLVIGGDVIHIGTMGPLYVCHTIHNVLDGTMDVWYMIVPANGIWYRMVIPDNLTIQKEVEVKETLPPPDPNKEWWE